VDVISQGRDPKRDFRLPLSRRWRIAAGCAAVLAVAVALTVTGLRLSRGAGTSGASGVTGGTAVPARQMPALPQGQMPAGPVFMVCAKSADGCTNKLIIVDGRAVHFAQQVQIQPSGQWRITNHSS
jgi:hypothetical protein